MLDIKVNTMQGIWTFCEFLHKRVIGKDKAIPLQALTGPEGSRRFRLPDFKTIGT
jgi:hypothetical protein